MKKYIIILLMLISAISLNAQTQTQNGAMLKFGIHGGINVSKFQTELDSTDVSGRPGGQVGLSFRYGNRFFIQGDFDLFMTTSQLIHIDTSLANVDIKSSVNRSMISVPITLGYKILSTSDSKAALYIAAGVEASSVLRTKLDENAFYLTKNDFQPFAFGTKASIGAVFFFLHVDLGFHWGLTPLLENDPKSYNRMVSLNIGVNF